MSRKQIILHTEWFNIEEQFPESVHSPDAKPYYKLNAPDGAMILAITPEKKIVLVKQHRPALGEYTLELPSGQIEEDETIEEAISRELFEETGYRCSATSYLGFGRVMSNRTAMKLHAFVGRDAELDPTFKARENIEVRLATYAELRDLVLTGQFQQWFALSLFLIMQWKNPLFRMDQ